MLECVVIDRKGSVETLPFSLISERYILNKNKSVAMDIEKCYNKEH